MVKQFQDIIKNVISGVGSVVPNIKIVNAPMLNGNEPFVSIMINEIKFDNPEIENDRAQNCEANCNILIWKNHNHLNELIDETDNIIDYIVKQFATNRDYSSYNFVDNSINYMINNIYIENIKKFVYQINQNEIIIEINIKIDFVKY